MRHNLLRQTLIALLAGLLFGAGLAVSGMADPQRVQSFLDLFGAWDPTLAFVMAGAILPMAFAWRLVPRMHQPVVGDGFHLPDTRRLDARLAGGAVLFGVGWGLAGLCPGPALTDLALAPSTAGPFVLAMLVGAILHRVINRQ